ncbi:MAG: hypothetical protein FWE76_01170 [Symbiobacteriaceae bacterium]|nr:hypothetical protein [Symbiobacteriaceae bacterium]
MLVLKGKRPCELDEDSFSSLISAFARIHLDIGTGSGRYILHHAFQNRSVFYIGLDPVAEVMAENSYKAAKRSKREDLYNTLFVIASLETFPAELIEVAHSVSVILPWGSLRDGLVRADGKILQCLRLSGGCGCSFEAILGYDNEREAGEIERRSLPLLSEDHFRQLLPEYAAQGISITQIESLNNIQLRHLASDWARKLSYGMPRNMFRLSGQFR